MTLRDVKPISYIFPVDSRGYVNPKVFHEMRNGEDLSDGPFIVDYHFEKGCHRLSAGMWYSSEGRFELVVNQCSQDTALRMFALAINVEHTAETKEPRKTNTPTTLFRIVVVYSDGWELLSRRFNHRSEADEWAVREDLGDRDSAFMIVNEKNANTEAIRAMLYE